MIAISNCAGLCRTFDPNNDACGGPCCFMKACDGFNPTYSYGLTSGGWGC